MAKKAVVLANCQHWASPAADPVDPSGVGDLQGPVLVVSAEHLREGIVDKLAARAAESSLCPSEVARNLGDDSWRDVMPAVREAAAQLALRGVVVATQGDTVVQADAAKGPIRIRRGPQWSTPVAP
ncbi:DUF3253 domain-containing protein [Corynebacterium sanguinis]|uniref:DUF3253 domain-containing protein n=1 Tax=Corynebacterium sanguinis TaxID=2594913 RepID=UPI0035CCCA48